MLLSLLLRTAVAFAAVDEDGDGFDATVDCDDTNAQVNPDAVERCDGIDNNCVSGTDEDAAVDAVAWWEDADGDGYPGEDTRHFSCDAPTGSIWVRETPFDCDDTDPDVGPCPEPAVGCATAPSGVGGLGVAVLGVMAMRRRRVTAAP